jgi:hypothetical protein
VTLSWEQVRASRLARHHLDARVPREQMHAVVSRLCGVHARLMGSAELTAAIADRSGSPELAERVGESWGHRAGRLPHRLGEQDSGRRRPVHHALREVDRRAEQRLVALDHLAREMTDR